mgnify:CR=1 FL=1
MRSSASGSVLYLSEWKSRHAESVVLSTSRSANPAVTCSPARFAATARAVIAVTSNDLINLEVALLVRELNSKQRVVLRLSDAALAQTLREAADIRFALSVPVLAAPAFVASLLGDRVRMTLDATDALSTVASSGWPGPASDSARTGRPIPACWPGSRAWSWWGLGSPGSPSANASGPEPGPWSSRASR